jgi:hypothetical protein
LTKKRSIIEDSIKSLISFILYQILKNVESIIRSYLLDLGKKLIRKLFFVAVGAFLMLLGIIFLSIASVNFLSIYMPVWAAWLWVGLLLFSVGVLIFVIYTKKGE